MTYEQAISAFTSLWANRDKMTTDDVTALAAIWNRQISGEITVDQAMTEGSAIIEEINRR